MAWTLCARLVRHLFDSASKDNTADTIRLRPSENVEKGAQDRPKVDIIIADCGEVNIFNHDSH